MHAHQSIMHQAHAAAPVHVTTHHFVALHCHLLQLATLAESTESTAIGLHHWWSNVLLYRLSLCALGRRKDNGETWGFKVEM